jgi:hypothetical protein
MTTSTIPPARSSSGGVNAERPEGAPARERKVELVGLSIAVALLLVRTMPGLWEHSFWLDEGYSREAIDHLRLSLGHYPGNMVLYKFFLVAWGAVSIVPWWLRLPSMVCAIATLGLARGIAGRIGGSLAAAIAPVTVAIVPMFWAKAIEARSYAPEILAVTAVWYCWLRTRDARPGSRAERKWAWVLAGIATIGPLLHALFVTQFIVVLMIALLARDRRSALRTLAPATIGCAATTYWMRSLAGNSPPGALRESPMPPDLIRGYLSGWWVAAVALGILGLVGLFSMVERHRTDHDSEALLPVLWVAVPLLVMSLIRAKEAIWDPRYVAPSAVAVGLLVALGFEKVLDRATDRHPMVPGRRASGGLAIAVLICLTSLGGTKPPSERFENWNGATRLIATHARPGDGLIFDQPPVFAHFRVPFEASWSLLSSPPTIPVISSHPRLGSVEITTESLAPAQIGTEARSCDRVWVVSYRDSWRAATVVGTRQFKRSFHLVDTTRFDGDVHVQLYRNISRPGQRRLASHAASSSVSTAGC